MPTYPTEADLLNAHADPSWIDDFYLRSDPFAFRQTSFRPVVSLITKEFDVDANGVFCIGSGAVGLSLNPEKVTGNALKRYDDASDLDLAVISEVHFETAWRDLRRAAAPSVTPLDELVATNLRHQKKRFFDGAILADRLLPVLSFGPAWIQSLNRLSELIALSLQRNVDVHMWVYRDYWSLQTYVLGGIVGCRAKVRNA